MGRKTETFLDWLGKYNVVVHNHEPIWIEGIENVRHIGDANMSNLKSHSDIHMSNYYIGSWQRIDIPTAIEAEYVLYLDADTIVIEPFTLADFGNPLTSSVALSEESEIGGKLNPTAKLRNELKISKQNSKKRMNSGVILMNVPKMRETRNAFLAYIDDVANSNGRRFFSMPFDEGAIMDFYKPTMLNVKFSMKTNFDTHLMKKLKDYPTTILHFDGFKPAEEIKRVAEKNTKSSCLALLMFSCIIEEEVDLRKEYCRVDLSENDGLFMESTCTKVLELLPWLSVETEEECDLVVQSILVLVKAQEEDATVLIDVQSVESVLSKLKDHTANQRANSHRGPKLHPGHQRANSHRGRTLHPGQPKKKHGSRILVIIVFLFYFVCIISALKFWKWLWRRFLLRNSATEGKIK